LITEGIDYCWLNSLEKNYYCGLIGKIKVNSFGSSTREKHYFRLIVWDKITAIPWDNLWMKK
jgi:hypothetical protein